MLPNLSGWDVLKKIRQKNNTPVIALTARVDEVDKLLGLELGLMTILRNLFHPGNSLLVLRQYCVVAARRSRLNIISFHNLSINPERLEALVGDILLALTATEFRILLLLTENPGQVFSRLHILERVFGDMYEGYERTIDTHISNLRHKIEATNQSEVSIKTVYSIGYKLVAGE